MVDPISVCTMEGKETGTQCQSNTNTATSELWNDHNSTSSSFVHGCATHSNSAHPSSPPHPRVSCQNILCHSMPLYPIIFDGRNIYNAPELESENFIYFQVGVRNKLEEWKSKLIYDESACYGYLGNARVVPREKLESARSHSRFSSEVSFLCSQKRIFSSFFENFRFSNCIFLRI